MNAEHSIDGTDGRRPEPSSWYIGAMERLVEVLHDLSQARNVDAVTAIVRTAARQLTGADGATFVLRDVDKCFYADEDAIEPLWKGKRFPMSQCVSGWVMLNRQPIVIEDIYQDDRVPTEAYRPTFVKSLAMVPIRHEAPVGAIGTYWATHRLPSAEEIAVLQALADTTSVALENAKLYADLEDKVRRLQAQEIRITGQRDALDVFTRALAHDLREPVRSLTSFSDMIGAPDVTADEAAHYFIRMRNAAKRMEMLVETVFQYTQVDDPYGAFAHELSQDVEGAPMSLDEIVTQRGAALARPLPGIAARRGQMEALFRHLLDNAFRHGGAGVSVRVDAQQKGERWRFTVTDDGAGIPEEMLEAIFEPFKRLENRDDCAGLGLSLCRKIVGAHGGRIWCESVAGRGTSVHVELPNEIVSDSTASDIAASALEDAISRAGSENPPRNANVLLVDDRDDDIAVAEMALVKRGKLQLNLTVARTGAEALGIMREMIGRGEMIDLTLIDINMPGMDGFELLERVRADPALAQLTVVMCTGSTHPRDVERAEALGAAGYLVKPPSLARLRPIVDRIAALRIDQDGETLKLLRAA